MDFTELADQINQEIERRSYTGHPSELYDPINYMLTLGGKRSRPILTLMGCYLYSGKTEPALEPALGVEAFHNFTLIHDDIMDESPLRRGQTTVHEKWNTNIAILAGDTLMFKAYELIIKADPALIPTIARIFNRVAVEVCEGQQCDMNFEQREQVGIDEYIEMIRQKTAVLIGFSLQLGALIGGATQEEAEKLRTYGEQLGIGFQLKDDLLDLYGDTQKTGKQSGGDIRNNKKAILVLEAQAHANNDQRIRLDEALSIEGDDEKKVATVKELFNEIGVREKVEERIKSHIDRANSQLDALHCDQKRLRRLSAYAQKLVDRVR